MENERRFQCQQMEDSQWVPRDTYEKLMQKLNDISCENSTLKMENERLRRECSGHPSLGGIPVGRNDDC
jgi:regulator of replication initiation timing